MKIIQRYYNKGYDVEVLILENGLLPIIAYHGKLLKPFLKKSNTRLQYPIVNIPHHGLQYCHRIVAFACLNIKQYHAMRKAKPNECIVIDHKNGNTLDYKPENLRFLYNSKNVQKDDGYMQPLTHKQCLLLKLNPVKYLNPEWFAEN